MLQLDILSVDSLDALLSGCPILETLDILDAPEPMSEFRVPTSLKRLKVTGVGSGTYLEIDSPDLQYLNITNSIFDAAVGNLQNVVEAYLDIFPMSKSESVNPLLNLLRALSGTKRLVLCRLTTKEASPLRKWEPQSTRVPNFLVSHLTYIRIKGYQGFEDELAFAEYILRNGLVLKTMIILADFSLDLGKKYCILKRLSDIPRGSVMCQLKFD